MAPGVGVCVWDHARQILRLPHFFRGEGHPGQMWRVGPSEGRGRCRAHVGGLAKAPEGRGTFTRAKVLRALLQAHPGAPGGESAGDDDRCSKIIDLAEVYRTPHSCN
jgi:hypothetical protein